MDWLGQRLGPVAAFWASLAAVSLFSFAVGRASACQQTSITNHYSDASSSTWKEAGLAPAADFVPSEIMTSPHFLWEGTLLANIPSDLYRNIYLYSSSQCTLTVPFFFLIDSRQTSPSRNLWIQVHFCYRRSLQICQILDH